MAMLKFRRGLWSQITDQATNPLADGTVYIATDEKAMYVDTATERIRIGDFIRVDTVKDITPPYSTSALYYVENDNALLKYTGVENGWKQVNGTDDLRAAIATLESSVQTHAGEINAIKGDIEDLQETVETHGTDIESLKTAIGMNEEGDVEGLSGTVAQLRTDLNALDSEVDGLAGRLESAESTILTHTNDINTLKAIDFATKADVNAAKEAVLGEAGYSGTVKGAYEAATTAKNQADTGVANAATAQAKADANEGLISALTGRVSALDAVGTGRVAVLEGKVDALQQVDVATKSDVATAKSEVLGSIADAAGAETVHGALKAAEAAQTKANANADAIQTLNGLLGGSDSGVVADLEKAQADATEALNKIGDENSGLTKAVADAQAQADKGVEDAATAQAAAEGAQAEAEGALAAAQGAQGTANQAVTDAANAQTAADNAQTAADDAQADATQALADAATAKNAADAAQSTADSAEDKADANAEAILELQGAVTTLNGDAKTDGSVAKAVADAKAELEDMIKEDINAANAMNYVDGVARFEDLPLTAPAGATYVVTALNSDFLIEGANVYPGDLLVATGVEDPELVNEDGATLIPASGLKWTVVKTGYDASLEQKISGEDNAIKLSTIGGTASEVSFAATGSATVAVANNVVTIGMEWEDFPAPTV